MASISGGHFALSAGHEQVSGGQASADAGRLSLGSVTHSTVAGGSSDTVGGSLGHSFGAAGDTVGSGFDTVSGLQHSGGAFSGQAQSGLHQVVATQTHEGGNTTLHLPDGSSIKVVGVTHIHATFLH